MHFSKVLAAVAALSVPLASATCLTNYEANLLAKNFGLLISDYSNSLANETLAPNFQDYSESVNTLIDSAGSSPVPLLGPTFQSRADFETGSAAQPPVPFTVKNVWYTCNVITVRWQSDQTPEPVVGISVLHTVYAPTLTDLLRFQIDEVWAEFDSGAWLVNLGVFKPAKKRELEFSA
nr:hypothetical protein CFP56_71099 [Quercus suber]